MQRSSEMWLVEYYLSYCGERQREGPTKPPIQLCTKRWQHAYAIFYRRLGAGRTLSSFANSLNNARDTFDSQHDSGRIGWRRSTKKREPVNIAGMALQTITQWSSKTVDEL